MGELSDYDKALRGMIYDPAIYDETWYGGLEWQHPWCHKLMGWLVGEFGPFRSSLDLGAGDGFYSHVLSEMGADPAVAVEHSPLFLDVSSERVQKVLHDLRAPLDMGRTYELLLCLEVAEHLPESAADTLCDTIARHCAGRLVFTAAPPGQGGHGHCNLQPFAYWREKLEARGLSFDVGGTAHVRRGWKNILDTHLPWLPKNISFFRRR